MYIVKFDEIFAILFHTLTSQHYMKNSLQNDRLIRALLRQPVDRTPIWIMRQAGRYLPEYREVRNSVSGFMALCQNPELACKVTLQPLARFDLDAAILFSDILTIPAAMGLDLHFAEGEGPIFNNPIRNAHDVQRLKTPDVEKDLDYVMQAIKLAKRELNNRVPLIGFAGSPWTMAAYMIEGGASKTFSKIKGMLYAAPELLHDVLAVLAESVIHYLNAQIESGVNAVMLFDTWGGLLSESAYLEFSLAYMQKILAGLVKTNAQGIVPTILFTKGGGLWLEHMAVSGCDAVGLDWTVNIGNAKKRVGSQVALQGNLDPAVLYGTATTIQREATQIMQDFGTGPGHIFNLGHGIYPDIEPEKVKILIDAIKGYHD